MTVHGNSDYDGVRILTGDWPVIVIEFPETRVSDAALYACLMRLEELMKKVGDRQEKTFVVTDITQMTEFPPKSQRQHTTDWMNRTLRLQKAVSLGSATVTRSTILREFMNALYWVAPPAMPTVLVATRPQAFTKAVEAFDKAGVPLRAELRTAMLARR